MLSRAQPKGYWTIHDGEMGSPSCRRGVLRASQRESVICHRFGEFLPCTTHCERYGGHWAGGHLGPRKGSVQRDVVTLRSGVLEVGPQGGLGQGAARAVGHAHFRGSSCNALYGDG